jgi:hypothetical protein
VGQLVLAEMRPDEPGHRFGPRGIIFSLEGCHHTVDYPFHVRYEL